MCYNKIEQKILNTLLDWYNSESYTRYISLDVIPEYYPDNELQKIGYLGFKGYIKDGKVSGDHFINTDFLIKFENDLDFKFKYQVIELGEKRDIYINSENIIFNVDIEGFKIYVDKISNYLLSNFHIKNNQVFIETLTLEKPILTSPNYLGSYLNLSYSLLFMNQVYVDTFIFSEIDAKSSFCNILGFLEIPSLNFKSCIVEYRWNIFEIYMLNMNILKYMHSRLSKLENYEIKVLDYMGDMERLRLDFLKYGLTNVICECEE